MDPALRVFLFLDALPQGLVWAAAVVLLALLAGRAFRWPKLPGKANATGWANRFPNTLELTGLLGRARFSPWARRYVRTRLARLAVALRVEQERIPPDQAWSELRQGSWPPDPRVRAFFRGEEDTSFWTALTQVVEALERYAAGGGW